MVGVGGQGSAGAQASEGPPHSAEKLLISVVQRQRGRFVHTYLPAAHVGLLLVVNSPAFWGSGK